VPLHFQENVQDTNGIVTLSLMTMLFLVVHLLATLTLFMLAVIVSGLLIPTKVLALKTFHVETLTASLLLIVDQDKSVLSTVAVELKENVHSLVIRSNSLHV